MLDIDISSAISDRGHQVIKKWKDGLPFNLPGGYWTLYLDNGLDDFFSADFLEKMKNLGFPVDMITCFYRKSRYCHPTAHIDGSLTRKVVFGLNWVLTPGKDDSEMVWYEMPKKQIPVTTTEYGTAQVDIDTSDLAETGRRCIGRRLTLVRVNIPHNIIVREQERFVISLRCNLDRVQSWEDAVESFKHMIIE